MKPKINRGDLVKSINGQEPFTCKPKIWFGMVLDMQENSPKKHPVYATKYRIQWLGGSAGGWYFDDEFDLVARAKNNDISK